MVKRSKMGDLMMSCDLTDVMRNKDYIIFYKIPDTTCTLIGQRVSMRVCKHKYMYDVLDLHVFLRTVL